MATNDFLPDDPLEMIKRGSLGPGLDPESVYGQFRNMLKSSSQSGAGYLSAAAGRAGSVPQGMASRVGAITQGAQQQAGVQLATSVSNFERQRYEGALNRWYSYWRDEQTADQNEQNMWGNIAGGLTGLIGNIVTMKALSGSGSSTASSGYRPSNISDSERLLK